MARTPSPLRYPGGKTALLKTVGGLLRLNGLDRGHYVEPFAGGGGLALSLLFRGDVGEIHLNDIDPAIASLWFSILENHKDLIGLMNATPVTIGERARQREIYLKKEGTRLELGFATLFLNRVNRSGIIRTGGAIGGLAQDGKYLLDCRFNKPDLESRIRRIAKYKNRIQFTALDASDFLKRIDKSLPDRTLVYADPPYFVRGAELYTSSFKPDDHAAFRDALTALRKPWILTYDDAPEIRGLYRSLPQFGFELNYSAQTKRVGSEILVASGNLRLTHELRVRQVNSISVEPWAA